MRGGNARGRDGGDAAQAQAPPGRAIRGPTPGSSPGARRRGIEPDPDDETLDDLRAKAAATRAARRRRPPRHDRRHRNKRRRRAAAGRPRLQLVELAPQQRKHQVTSRRGPRGLPVLRACVINVDTALVEPGLRVDRDCRRQRGSEWGRPRRPVKGGCCYRV